MRVLRLTAEETRKIASILERHASENLQRIAASLLMVAREAGNDGKVSITPERNRRKREIWTAEEVDLFIGAIEHYRTTDDWQPGTQYKVWERIGIEMKRSPASLKTKYAQLLRRGVIRDDRTSGVQPE